MIPSSREISYRLTGAWLLARFDARGALYFEESRGAALRSFFAAAITAPAFTVIALLSLATRDVKEDLPAVTVMLLYGLFYCLSWVAAPVAIHQICLAIGRERAFFRFLSATNWISVITFHLNLVVIILVTGGVLPGPLAGLLIVALYGYVVAYQWFVNLHCLGVSTLAAVAFVGVQLIIHFLLESIVLDIVFQASG